MKQSVQSQTQRFLAQRVLLTDLAKQLGILMPDQSLADWIVQNFKSGEEGFDPLAYKNHLGSFQGRFRLSYEELIKEDLLLQKTQDWLEKMLAIPQNVAEQDQAIGQPQWVFEKWTCDQEADAKAIAAGQKPPSSKAVQHETVGPIHLAERKQLIPNDLSDVQWKKIFQLTPAKPLLSEPIPSNGKFVVVKLGTNKTDKKKTAEPPPDSSQATAGLWLSSLMQQAKIKVSIPHE